MSNKIGAFSFLRAIEHDEAPDEAHDFWLELLAEEASLSDPHFEAEQRINEEARKNRTPEQIETERTDERRQQWMERRSQ
jgi:hypothetical protein